MGKLQLQLTLELLLLVNTRNALTFWALEFPSVMAGNTEVKHTINYMVMITVGNSSETTPKPCIISTSFTFYLLFLLFKFVANY